MANANEPQKQITPEQTAAGMKNELVDRSRFIRTMAKDMAALSGGGPQNAKPEPAPMPPPAPVAPQQEAVSGIWLPKPEEPFFEHREPAAPEPVSLPPITETVPIAPPAPGEDRDAILERLRRKVSERAPAPVKEAPAPMPEVPTPPPIATPPEPVKPVQAPPAWQNVPAPMPEFAPLAEPAPERLPPLAKTAGGEDRYREPVEAAPPPRPAAAAPLHTYSSDFAGRIDDRGASTFSVLAAEQDARAVPPEAVPVRRSGGGKAVLAIATGVVLLALAAGGIFATYRFVMTMRDTPVASFTLPTTVHADEYRELTGTGQGLLTALAALAGEAIVPGNVLVTYINTERTGEDGVSVTGPAGAAAFLRAAQVPAPDILLRNLAEESTVGIVSVGGERTPFFALRVDSYERTYAGMLTWEPLMLRDLGLLYPLHAPAALPEPEPEPVATSTATSTVALEEPAAPGAALTRFADAIVANRDVRILRDTNGKALMLYGYADKRTLLIARDEAAFAALLERLKAN